MSCKRKATALIVLGVLVLNLVVIVQPVAACTAGCTPGFWKQPQHFGYWTDPYTPIGDNATLVVDVFFAAELYVDADDALLDALSYHGGPGAAGAAQNLLRAAGALLLTSAYDAAHDEVSFGYDWLTVDRITETVNHALATGNRDHMLGLAKMFDGYNKLGCPLKN